MVDPFHGPDFALVLGREIHALLGRIGNVESFFVGVVERADQLPFDHIAEVDRQIDLIAEALQLFGDRLHLVQIAGGNKRVAISHRPPVGLAGRFIRLGLANQPGHGVAAELDAGVVEHLGNQPIGRRRVGRHSHSKARRRARLECLVSTANFSSAAVGNLPPWRSCRSAIASTEARSQLAARGPASSRAARIAGRAATSAAESFSPGLAGPVRCRPPRAANRLERGQLLLDARRRGLTGDTQPARRHVAAKAVINRRQHELITEIVVAGNRSSPHFSRSPGLGKQKPFGTPYRHNCAWDLNVGPALRRWRQVLVASRRCPPAACGFRGRRSHCQSGSDRAADFGRRLPDAFMAPRGSRRRLRVNRFTVKGLGRCLSAWPGNCVSHRRLRYGYANWQPAEAGPWP